MDCSLPGSSVHGILEARILERAAIPFSRGSSDSLLFEPPRGWVGPVTTQEELLYQQACLPLPSGDSEGVYFQPGRTCFLLPRGKQPAESRVGGGHTGSIHSFPFLSLEARSEQQKVPGSAQGRGPGSIIGMTPMRPCSPHLQTGQEGMSPPSRFPRSLPTWDQPAHGSTCCCRSQQHVPFSH